MSVSTFRGTHDDSQARRDALDTEQSFIVEAPAGSGKTGLLIQRYLRLLRVVDQPESVLALTFTNKATAEMRHRVLAALQTAHEPLPETASAYERETWTIAREVLEHGKQHRWDLEAQPYRLNMRTIDSLCGEIARGVPVLSGGIGNATPLPDAEPLYRSAARTVLLQLGGPDATLNRALETVLHHRDADVADCETLLAEMLATREQWGSLVPLSRRELNDATLNEEVLPRLNAALEQVLCNALTDIRRRFPMDVLQEVATLAHLLAEAEGYGDAPNPLGACAAMPHAPGVEADDVEHWKHLAHLLTTPSGGWRKGFNVNHIGFKMSKAEKARLTEAVEFLRHDDILMNLLCSLRDLPPRIYPADQWRVAKALFIVLHHALIELRLLFAAREVCDFTELSIAARSALQNGDGAAEALNLRLEHLLVDEMQDTSSAQYELLEALTSHWDGRTQTIFLVGDPKQSIYLFRQARVERFVEAMQTGRLGDIAVIPLQLTSNFRSGGALVQQFNRTFDLVFDPSGPIRYTVATPALASSADDTLEWNATPLPVTDMQTRGAEVKRSLREEAESIAAFAHHWRSRPDGNTTPRKIAVLVRSRTHALQTMRMLAVAGVPFRAVEMEALGERPEILDLLSLTRALLHPADRTAWLAVLRAPWCSLALADLHTLAAGDEATTRKQALRPHLRARAEALSSEARTRALHTLDVLDRLIETRGRAPLSVDVDRAWTALHGDRTTDASGRTNARRYLELLETMEAAGDTIDAATLKARLEKLFAEPNAAPDTVEVLTIHKAKGLEWDAVLVPSLHRAGMSDRAPLLDWMELPHDGNGQRQVLLAPIAKRGDDPDSLNRYVRKARADAASAELRRLFYVAATRARTSLQLYASPLRNKDGTVSRSKNSLLEAAWKAAETYFPAEATAEELPAAIPFPQPLRIDVPGLALAAGADDFDAVDEQTGTEQRNVVLERLPLSLIEQPVERCPFEVPHAAAVERAPARPQGSVSARVMGTTVHVFLQMLAAERLQSANAEDLRARIRGWTPRMRTLARSGGLSAREVERVAGQTLTALENTLAYAPAAWLFEPHRAARNEGELIEVLRGGEHADRILRFRYDRSFFAGNAPQTEGDDVLWIVDYKTSTYREAEFNGRVREEFLARERESYEPHLRNYARLMLKDLPAGTRVMLGLYYPLLPWLDVFPYIEA